MPLINEVIRVGNTTARIKNLYANGLMIIYDVRGELNVGDTITCDDSGESIVLTTFSIEDKYDLFYDEPVANLMVIPVIVTDIGAYIALDAHFTGAPSANDQTTNLIVEST